MVEFQLFLDPFNTENLEDTIVGYLQQNTYCRESLDGSSLLLIGWFLCSLNRMYQEKT